MSREAMITINCERYSQKMMDIVNLFIESGWKYYDIENSVGYLPLGDNDLFDWRKSDLKAEKLEELIKEKQAKNELIGLDMYYGDSEVGVTILARDTNEIMINLAINRKTLDMDRESITDIGWYFTNILQKLKQKECLIDSIKFEEYTD